ncbi:Phosphoglucosamine mutase [uncultured archaeon]|nr:Phosphoglucosamine mutase [uncultured archaeon]
MVSFGTSGIRDLCPGVVSPSLARRLGMALGANPKNWLSTHSPADGSLSIGFDGRRSGVMLKSALASGAMGVGCHVHDLGLCSTPTLALHSQAQEGWGVMVTASHNPPEYNGLKVFWRGREVPDLWERKIEKQLQELERAPSFSHTSWSGAGALIDSSASAKAAHMRLLLKSIPLALIRRKKPKVVVDCANASGCAMMPELLRAAGCRVEVLNGKAGEPYGRVLEPKKETLGNLSSAVRKHHADLGIAHDGDADRAIILDEKGKMLGLDAQLAIVTNDILQTTKHKSSKPPIIISTVESSLSLRESVYALGGRLQITPVGSRNVAAAMRQTGAIFGGEPCGEYIFPGGVEVPDGPACGLYFISLFCKKGKLSRMADEIPSYPMQREKIACSNERKADAMAALEKDWPFFGPSRVDGLRSDLDDGWVLVRPSGTEPYIRITAEGKDKKSLHRRVASVRALVERAIRP